MQLKLILGDWSGDGHSITDTVMIESNFTKAQIQAAYSKGCNELGFDFDSVCCAEYEDSSIMEKYVDALMERGILFLKPAEDCSACERNPNGCELCVDKDDEWSWSDVPEYDKYNYTTGKHDKIPATHEWHCDGMQETYTEIWLRIAKLGDPNFQYEYIPFDYNSEIHIGGYGLFGP